MAVVEAWLHRQQLSGEVMGRPDWCVRQGVDQKDVPIVCGVPLKPGETCHPRRQSSMVVQCQQFRNHQHYCEK